MRTKQKRTLLLPLDREGSQKLGQPTQIATVHESLDDIRRESRQGYQGGRRFDAELIDQLEMLPELVAACGFACAKAAGYEADDFLAAAVADRGLSPSRKR